MGFEGTLDLEQDLVILKAQVKAGNGFACWRPEYPASRDIKDGAVPRTGNLRTSNFALTKRTADVCATVVNRMKGSRDVKECYLAAVDLDQFGLAGRDLINFRDFQVFGHKTDCYLAPSTVNRTKIFCRDRTMQAQFTISFQMKLAQLMMR